MKIALIGPVYPYKGGISHYTGLLCKALRQKHEVIMLSYKMQYPKLLFKKEQRDYSNRSFEIANTQYLLNTANPVNIIMVANKIKKERPDLILIQWWHPYFAPCYYLLSLCLKKIPIVFTCHNVFPHERFPFDRFLTNLTLKRGTGFIVQSHLDEADLLTIKPNADYVVTPHPTYNAFKMQNISKAKARDFLHISSETPVLLFFGFVREYKGLNYLIDAMPLIKNQIPDVSLWIVGDFDDQRDNYIGKINNLGLQNNIHLVEGYIPDQEVEPYFAAADLVVLPYISATQSGIAQIAYGFEKPVVVTDVGGLPDVVEDGKTGYIVPSRNSEAIAHAVLRFFHEDQRINWTQNIQNKSNDFSWETMVKQIETLSPFQVR